MNKKKFTKLLALYLPYLVIGLAATNFGEAWRLAEGKELGDRIVSLIDTLPAAFANPLPSLHPLDILVGICCGAGLRLAVYLKSKNAKKYRHGMEYGSARWGTPADIAPFMAPKFEDNIILTKTERLMMSNRPPDPKNARNARSELMPDLQIVPQEQFENAQRIRNERSVRSTAEAENRLPLNIHGKSLLAGNAYCGHCGAKLELTSSRKWRKMADGSLDDTLRIRYTCYGKLRKQTNCTGQTGYTVHILDEIIDKAVRQIFSKMRGIPKEQIVTKRYEKENAERKNHLQDLQTQRNKAEKDLLALKTEVLACIKGESVLPRETLAEMITAQEEKLTELENLCEAASEELEKTAELMDKVSRLYDELISYADLYDSANFEAKKMIVNQLIRRVDVYRGYQINISFNFDLTPYIEGE